MHKITEAALDRALAHIETRGDTFVLPLPFEYQALRAGWDSVRPWLANQDLDMWPTGPYRRCLAPKGRLGFRIVTQLDPFDTLIITALMFEVGTELESVRVPRSEGVVHSYRFDPSTSGQLYAEDSSYETFRLRSLDLARKPSTRFVVRTDISDFFPRLYAHVLENALRATPANPDAVRVIKKLLSLWNMSVSYGVPIGPIAFRLLAEVAIGDIDEALRSEGYAYCRFVDDFHIFTETERQANEALAFLANALFRNHGLTLQESKTEILPARDFLERFARSERDREGEGLQDRLGELLEAAGLGDAYETISLDELEPEDQEAIDSLNLWELFRQQLESPAPLDVTLVRFVLRRIAQLRLEDTNGLLLKDLGRMFPAFRELIEAVGSQLGLSTSRHQEIGAQLLSLIDHPVVGHLQFHRAWILSLFANDSDWDHSNSLVRLYNDYGFDEFTRRELVLALGRAHQFHWFKTRKHDVLSLPPWEKRAFLAAASCLPGDEADHWYRSLRPRLTKLEEAVVDWARTNRY